VAPSPGRSTALRSPLYIICDDEICRSKGWPIGDFAAACLDGGARLLQLRVKTASARLFASAAQDLVKRAEPYDAQVIVNDRADIARMTGAAGVHVGQDDLTPVDARLVVGDGAIVGLSTHTESQLQAALLEPISYAAIGPVFGTSTKNTGYEALGLDKVRAAASFLRSRDMPLVAIGGITLERAADVVRAGAHAVAIITDLLSGGDPARRVRQYLDALQAG
jgi:thiamine-phosphate pyrophosphorylase